MRYRIEVPALCANPSPRHQTREPVGQQQLLAQSKSFSVDYVDHHHSIRQYNEGFWFLKSKLGSKFDFLCQFFVPIWFSMSKFEEKVNFCPNFCVDGLNLGFGVKIFVFFLCHNQKKSQFLSNFWCLRSKFGCYV